MLNTYNKSLLQSLCSRVKSKQCQRSLASPAASVSPRKVEKSPEVKRAPETHSFVMNLFRGRAVLDQVFPYPLNLNDDRREMLQMVLSPTEKFLAEVNNPFENDEKAEISKDVLKQFAELGAFGAVVPEELEGAGLNNTQMARLAEVVGANDLGLGVVMGAHQSIGYKGILLFGSDELKRKYLPDLATGRKFAAFCLTEPSSGSDANSIQSQAVKSPDGKHYIINGSKIWISNGGFADVFTVFAQTPIKKPDGTTRNQVSAFVVERAFGGVTSGAPEKKMGIKGSNTAEVYFEDVKVPVENLLGQEGEGFKVAMNILNNGRFGIPAACTGAMKYCIQKTIDHVTTRVQFGKKLYEFGNVQEKVTDMIVRHYATESIVYMLASNMDAGVQDYQLEAAIGKVFASENAWHVCDEAIQLHGGMGFMKECGLERVLRDLRIFRIFEGANDVMRLFVALTGAQFAGKHLQQLQKEIQSVNLSALFGELKRQVIPAVGADIGQVIHPSLKQHGTDVTKTIAAFGSTVDKLLKKHRKGIIDRQYELIRVANAAIDIYAMVAVLSRCSYTLNKSGNAPHEQKIVELFVKQASARAQENLRQAVNVGDDHIALISKIATDVFDHKAMIQQHPVDV